MNNLAPELVVQECTTNTQQESYHSILSNRSDGLSGKPTTDHILSLSIHEDNIFTGCPFASRELTYAFRKNILQNFSFKPIPLLH